MSAHVMIMGAVFRDPEQRTAKTGRPFVTATVKVPDGDRGQFWNVLAFSESVGAELLRLRDGDVVRVQGTLRVEPYEKEGQTRIGFTVMASQVNALRGEKKKVGSTKTTSKPADDCSRGRQTEPEQHPLNRYGGAGGYADSTLDDEVPF